MLETDSLEYFVAGWGAILFSIWGMSKFEGTRTLLYYLFWLGIVLDIVTHYEFFITEYNTIFNTTGTGNTTLPVIVGPGQQYPGGPGTIVNSPGSSKPIKTQPGNSVKTEKPPIVSLPSIIENYIF